MYSPAPARAWISALPPSSETSGPISSPSALNWTVPVGVPVAPATTAVRVVTWPATEGFGATDTVVVLATVCACATATLAHSPAITATTQRVVRRSSRILLLLMSSR